MIKYKIILINYYFKFSLNKTEYKYICGLAIDNLKKFTYSTTIKNKVFNCYFTFLKKIKKLFLFKKSYFLDSFIFKKKASILKKNDNAKRYLLFRTRSLLNFNRKTYKNLIFNFKKNKKKIFKKSLNLFFFDKNIFKKKKNNVNLIPMRRGFFKSLLNNRKLVRTIFFFKFKKQKSINKILSKKNFYPTNKFYLLHEFELLNLLIRSQFFFFKTDATYFIKNNFVYVNGFVENKVNKKLNVGDRIQLEVSYRYYCYFRSQQNHSRFFFKKIKSKLTRLFRPKFDLYKQRSTTTPN